MKRTAFDYDIEGFWNELVEKIPESDIDHWQTDLYLRSTPTSDMLVNKYLGDMGGMLSMFVSDGGVWYDLPFAYLPEWEKHMSSRKTAAWFSDSMWMGGISDGLINDVGSYTFWFTPLDCFNEVYCDVDVIEYDDVTDSGIAELFVSTSAWDPDGSFELAHQECGRDTIEFSSQDEIEDKAYDIYYYADTSYVEQVAEDEFRRYYDEEEMGW